MKVFGEERLNTYFSNNQCAPAIGSLSGGGYVVAWVSDGQDGSVDGLYAQRLDANGVGIGAEFRVNTTTGNYQNDPALVGLSNGGFLIVWADNVADGSSWGVFGQRYDATGVAQGNEFRINSYTANDQGQPSIAAYDGGFVVTWYSNGEDGSGYGVYSQWHYLKVISTNIHTVEAGWIKMSHLGRSGFRSSLDSTACMASLATVIPFS